MAQRATDVVNRAFASGEIQDSLETIQSFLREGSELQQAISNIAEETLKNMGHDLIMQAHDEDLPVVRACVATLSIVFNKLLEQKT